MGMSGIAQASPSLSLTRTLPPMPLQIQITGGYLRTLFNLANVHLATRFDVQGSCVFIDFATIPDAEAFVAAGIRTDILDPHTRVNLNRGGPGKSIEVHQRYTNRF